VDVRPEHTLEDYAAVANLAEAVGELQAEACGGMSCISISADEPLPGAAPGVMFRDSRAGHGGDGRRRPTERRMRRKCFTQK
jgi:hypothetical protein